MQMRWFNRGVEAIVRTPPVRLDPRSSVQTVTQLYPPDIWMFAVAIRAFARFVPLRACWIVADRLLPEHKAFLQAQVTGLQIIDTTKVDTSGFPTGGTWERLLHIIDISAGHYTIQLDADTITSSSPTEVIECAATGRCFTLGTSMGREVVAGRDVARQLAHLAAPDNHIQIAAELTFADKHDPATRYVRGNSAFAGFAPGATSRARLKEFSDAMASAVGESRWREWGSEQVASNWCVANAPGGMVLPFERYRYFDPVADLSGAAFLHFIGPHRFSAGVYRRMSREVIAQLGRGADASAA